VGTSTTSGAFTSLNIVLVVFVVAVILTLIFVYVTKRKSKIP
jgi:competence protein ComGC